MLAAGRLRRIQPVAGFTPASIAGLLAWYKADTLGLSDGATVASWPSAIGGGEALAQAADIWKPIYKPGIQNGRGVVRFDGTTKRLANAIAQSYAHLFVVAKYSAATFANFVGLVDGDTNNAANIILTGNSGADSWYTGSSTFSTYHKDGVSTALSAAGSGPMNAWAVMSISGTATSLKLMVGDDRNASRSWNGDIGEILAYGSVLSTSDRHAVEGYLKTRWGTP